MLVAAPAIAADVTAEDGVVVTADQSAARQSGHDRRQRSVQEAGPCQPRVRRAPGGYPAIAVTVIPQAIIEQTSALDSLQDLLCATRPASPSGQARRRSAPGRPSLHPRVSRRATTSSWTASVTRAASSARSSTSNRSRSSRGPDAVYSGRGSGGGSINLASKSPKLNAFHQRVSAGVGHGRLSARHGRCEPAAGRDRRPAHQSDGRPGRRAPAVTPSTTTNGVRPHQPGRRPGHAVSTMVFSYYHLDQRPDARLRHSAVSPRWGAQSRTPTGRIRRVWMSAAMTAFYGLKARDYLTNDGGCVHLRLDRASPQRFRLDDPQRQPSTRKTLNDYIVTNPGDGGYVGRS